MENNVNCVPQQQYNPDEVLENYMEGWVCEHCGKETIFAEMEDTAYDWDVSYKCHNCNKYVAER